MVIEILFDKGTLILEHWPENLQFPFVKFDGRTKNYRAPAFYYRDLVLKLRSLAIPYLDKARTFSPVTLQLQEAFTPRTYQEEALKRWAHGGSRGVVSLPTGAGKTILAVMAIAHTNRPTLVHVPTIDLMHQWYATLTRYFKMPIGLLGGGYFQYETITVTTYDSALLAVNAKGNHFGLLIFDECHHLPGAQTQYAAISSLAPFRLGLTATLERADGRESVLFQLCGPLCYQIGITELKGTSLAPYDVRTIEVEMGEEQRLEYEEARRVYVSFLKAKNISFKEQNSWQKFIWAANRSREGKEAFKAYLKQKKLSQSHGAKEENVWLLLKKHWGERILIFTQDNETAYNLGKKFYLPVITHHTKVKEREQFLTNFRQGLYKVLVTSKVLNEGVDVPEASIAIVVSGSATVREHVQRLGRILRASQGKRAILYELVSKDTAEYFVNQRRRQHSAYQKSPAL